MSVGQDKTSVNETTIRGRLNSPWACRNQPNSEMSCDPDPTKPSRTAQLRVQHWHHSRPSTSPSQRGQGRSENQPGTDQQNARGLICAPGSSIQSSSDSGTTPELVQGRIGWPTSMDCQRARLAPALVLCAVAAPIPSGAPLCGPKAATRPPLDVSRGSSWLG